MRALAAVNLAAIERNVARLLRSLAPGTALCAVVKADGYGHGALPVARAALAAGAGWLAVATAVEAEELRRGGIAVPILVMGALSTEELPIALSARADVVAWSEPFVAELLRLAAADGGAAEPVRVHVKLDTGMGRLGTRDPAEARAVAEAVSAAAPALRLTGAMTHFATADDPADGGFMAGQLRRYEPFVAELRRAAPGIVVHAANSAATLRDPATHHDLVRCGIAVYGGDPGNRDPAARGLEPALELRTYVAAVKPARVGESTGYGRTWVAASATWLATLPIGYGDGVRRALSNNAEVIVGGHRCPLVGNVSMDNVTAELGPGGPPPGVGVGTPAWIIGGEAGGGERVGAEELARRIGTINYEIFCGISRRVPRAYHRDGEPV